ncbi:hypothetical protein Tco_0687842 [Tanacetum coccineum]
MVAYLQKPEGSEAFHQIVDFLNASHVKYALIENPKIYISLIQQFWGTATARTTDDVEVEITASIDGQVKTITEASLRRHLKLEDSDGINSLPNTEISEQLALMGYVSDSTRLTFQKGHFSPQWRTYPTPTLIQKLFSNMKRVSKGYSGVDFPLFPTMITTPESSPSRITSSPSLSPQTHQSHQSSPLRDITREATKIPQFQFPTQTQVADEATFTSVDVDAGGAATTDIGLDAGQGSGTIHKTPTRPNDSPLPRVHTLGSDEGSLQQNELMDLVTKLTDRVEVLKNDMQQTKKISEIDKDPIISLVQPEQDMEYDFDVSTAEGFTTASIPVTTAGIEISTANISVSTASVTPEVSTAAENLVYIRRSAEKRKDKGKAIMKEDESVQKKSKKQLEQERLGHEEAIRLQEQINEEERQRIARDAEIAKQLQEEFDRARQEQEVVAEVDQAHDIDWSDPAVLRYHAVQNRSFSKAEVRKNIEGQDVVEEPAKRQRTEEASGSVQEQTCEEPKAEELSQEQLHQMIMVIPVEEVYVEALQKFDRDGLDKLWNLVKERFRTIEPTEDKARELWVELKRLFEPDDNDTLWKLQRYMHDPLKWWLYDTCGVHHVSTERGHDIYMLVEKDYPLTNALATLMLCNKLRVDQYSDIEMSSYRKST